MNDLFKDLYGFLMENPTVNKMWVEEDKVWGTCVGKYNAFCFGLENFGEFLVPFILDRQREKNE